MNTGKIYKGKHAGNFTVIPNAILEDARLGLKEIGLLCYLLKLPPNWQLHKTRLHTKLKDGRDAVAAAFKALEDVGYITRVQVRGNSGTFIGYNYEVNDGSDTGNQFTGNPSAGDKDQDQVTEKPTPEKPKSENPPLIKKDINNTIPLPSTNVDDKGPSIKKPVKPPKKEPSKLYPRFIEIYFNWFQDQNEGVPPKMDKGNGNAAKSLIGYFETIVKARAKIENLDLDQAAIDQRVVDSWTLVLTNWNKIEPFYQDKTRLVDINSNIQNIIKQIKDGARAKKEEQRSGKIGSDAVRDIFDRIDERHAKQATA